MQNQTVPTEGRSSEQIENLAGSSSHALLGVVWMLAETGVAYAAISGIKGAENLITLLAITSALLGFLGLFALVAVKDMKRRRPRWSVWIANVCDLAIVVMLAWKGWMWIAAAWAWGFLISWLIRDKTVFPPNVKRMHPYQQGRASITGLML